METLKRLQKYCLPKGLHAPYEGNLRKKVLFVNFVQQVVHHLGSPVLQAKCEEDGNSGAKSDPHSPRNGGDSPHQSISGIMTSLCLSRICSIVWIKRTIPSPDHSSSYGMAGWCLPGFYCGIRAPLLIPDARYPVGLCETRPKSGRICCLLCGCSNIHRCDCDVCSRCISSSFFHSQEQQGITMCSMVPGEGNEPYCKSNGRFRGYSLIQDLESGLRSPFHNSRGAFGRHGS